MEFLDKNKLINKLNYFLVAPFWAFMIVLILSDMKFTY